MHKKSQAEDRLDQINIKVCQPFSFKTVINDNLSHNTNEEEIYYLRGSHDCEL